MTEEVQIWLTCLRLEENKILHDFYSSNSRHGWQRMANRCKGCYYCCFPSNLPFSFFLPNIPNFLLHLPGWHKVLVPYSKWSVCNPLRFKFKLLDYLRQREDLIYLFVINLLKSPPQPRAFLRAIKLLTIASPSSSDITSLRGFVQLFICWWLPHLHLQSWYFHIHIGSICAWNWLELKKYTYASDQIGRYATAFLTDFDSQMDHLDDINFSISLGYAIEGA